MSLQQHGLGSTASVQQNMPATATRHLSCTCPSQKNTSAELRRAVLGMDLSLDPAAVALLPAGCCQLACAPPWTAVQPPTDRLAHVTPSLTRLHMPTPNILSGSMMPGLLVNSWAAGRLQAALPPRSNYASAH
mmetsp:Transcript_22656/g.49632  ORF Transcript_22656/g.49632 Transcript_22656/m.49632 type:complete len:133 (+) Transcript_22656:378-776(+)